MSKFTKSDKEALTNLYIEKWEDNPYIDDVEAIRKHQNEVDRESGRIQPVITGRQETPDGVFETDPEKMIQGRDSRYEHMKLSFIRNINYIRDQYENNAAGLGVLRPLQLALKSWAKDLNMMDDPDIIKALSNTTMRKR